MTRNSESVLANRDASVQSGDMTNAELATLLNDRSGLIGRNAITGNIVRQWVEWDLLPAATATGQRYGTAPIWSRSEISIRRALRLAELRKFGTKRENALIVQAYIDWGHPDFDRVRDALCKEWEKWTKQLARQQTTFLGDAGYAELSAVRKRAIANQLGTLDSRFQGSGFELPLQVYAVLAELARTGTIAKADQNEILLSALEQIYPGIALHIPAECVADVANSIPGIAGSADEIGNSAAQAISGASESHFREARHKIRIVQRHWQKIANFPQLEIPNFNFLEFAEIARSIGPQIFTGPWLISLFVLALIGVIRK